MSGQIFVDGLMGVLFTLNRIALSPLGTNCCKRRGGSPYVPCPDGHVEFDGFLGRCMKNDFLSSPSGIHGTLQIIIELDCLGIF